MNNENMEDLFEKLNSLAGNNNISQDTVNNLFNMLNNSNKTASSNNYSDSTSTDSKSSNLSSNNYSDFKKNNSGIDFETIMKMKNIIDSMNIKDDPRSNLLQSLKPYLKESRKSKVDQYIQLMNMSKVMEVFPFIGGDKKQ